MPKVNRCGQASVWTDQDLIRFRRAIKNPRHLLMVDLLQYTGERVGAMVQLRVEDVYEDVQAKVPRKDILYRASTRKRSPDGKRSSRGVPTHPALYQALQAYTPPETGYLFPSPRDRQKPVTTTSVDRWFRQAIERAGLTGRGYSLHSFRRTAPTIMHRNGIGVRLIQKFTGHKSLTSLQRYLDCDEAEVAEAVKLL